MHVEFPDKLYYSIGEVAGALKVNSSLIRFWEKNFDIIKPKKNKKGNRFFLKEDIENLKIIFHLTKERGYSLKGAQSLLESNKKIVKEIQIIHELEAIKAELMKIKNSFDF